MSGDDYSDFVHTGPGSPAGRYLRMFWQPVHRADDLSPGDVVPMQIMGERFTLYRGESGAPHVMAFRCAHRGTQLPSGWVEGDCLRCLYHGWRYDGSGQCVEQPGEDESFAAKVRIRSYPTREYLGLIFAYLGEGEPPEFRRFLDLEAPGVLEVNPAEHVPCNYFNRIDNACDASHAAFTHHEGFGRGHTDSYDFVVRSIRSEETEYGVRTTMEFANKPPNYLHFHMPNVNQIRSPVRFRPYVGPARTLSVDMLFFRVPVNDENSVSFVVNLTHLDGDEAEQYRRRKRDEEQASPVSFQELLALGDEVVAGRVRLKDLDGRLTVYQLFTIEDYVAQVGQGPIADREHERLGRNDVGVILLRKLWQRELKALVEGGPVKQWTSPAGLGEMVTGAATHPG